MDASMRSYHRGSVVVAETDFVVRYDGQGIDEGRIDERDLAPSLFALRTSVFLRDETGAMTS
jgi:hypothetical protein